MKQLYFFSAGLIVCMLQVLSPVVAQTRQQKAFAKTEDNLTKGNPGSSLKTNESLIASLQNKGDINNETAVRAFAKRTRIQAATGAHYGFEKTAGEALAQVRKVYNDTGMVAAEALLEIAVAYYEYGNLQKAYSITNTANSAYNKAFRKKESFNGEYLLLCSRIRLGQGYFRAADSLATTAMPLLHKRIVKTEKQTDAKGRIKDVKLSSAEQIRRKTAYAWATSVKARAAYERGLYSRGDSLYNSSNNWIRSNLGTSNPVYSAYLQHQADLEEEKGNLRTAETYTERALASVKKRADASYFNAYDKMLYGTMVKNRFLATPRKELTLLDRKTRIYHKKNNIYYANKQIREEWFTARKLESNKVEERLDDLINRSSYVPAFHPSRISAQEIYILLDSRERKLKSVEDTLISITKVARELYGDKAPAYHLKRLNLADFYLHKTNNLKRAEELYLESFNGVLSKEILPSHKEYVNYLSRIGMTYFLSENFTSALEYFLKAEKQAAVNFPDKPEYAVTAANLAWVYLSIGKYKQARELFSKAENILNKGDDDTYTPEYARAYQEIAEGYSIFGLYDKAQNCIARSQKIIQANVKKGYDEAENSSPDDLAELYIGTGRYRDAERILKQSVEEKEKLRGNSLKELIKPYNLLGKLYFTTGDYGQSENYLNKAAKLSASISGDTSLRYAESLKILRKLYMAFGDYEKAEKVTRKQLEVTAGILGKTNVNYAEGMADLALIRYFLSGNASASRKMLYEASGIIRTQLGADNPFYISGLKTLAFFQLETGQLNSADSLIKVNESYWTTRLGKENPYTAGLEVMKGDLLRKQNRQEAALEKYEKALSLYKKTFSSKHPDYVRTQSRLARTYFEKGDYKNTLSTLNIVTQNYYDFIARYFPVLSFGEKSKYWESIKGDFEFFNTVALKMKDQNPDLIGQMYDYELATKALLLSNSIKVRHRISSSGDKALIARFNTWNEKKELYTRSLSYSSARLSEEKIDQPKLEREIEELEKELSASSEEFARGFENRTFRWKDVRKTLREKEAAVEMVRFRHFNGAFTDSVIYAALIVTPQTSNAPEFVILPNGSQMEKKYIKYYRNTIKYRNEDEASYEIFWKAIDSKLKGTETIYLSGEGVYNQINLETLRDNNQKYMIDKYNIVLVSNTRDLVMNRLYQKKKIKKEGANRVLLVGNPKFYSDEAKVSARSIKDLAGAEVEAKEISELYAGNKWKSSLLVKESAEEEKIKSIEGPRIIHIATHGYFQPDGKNNQSSGLEKGEINPLFRSGLLLASAGDLIDNDFTAGNVNSQSGILTAYEAMNMNLDQTELVTLSACETGLGDVQIGEGVAGLQRAFLVAGADNVVMSLFKVSDEVTEKLMLTFYSKWLKTGDKRKAFTDAKKEIKAQYPESIYWGSFIMIGAD